VSAYTSIYYGTPQSITGRPAGDEEHPESVLLRVAEAAGDAAVEFDETVDGLGAAAARATGVEVG
jgi:hypothetical protein